MELTRKQRSDLQSGKAVLVEGIKGYDGKTISQYVKANFNQGRLDFYNENPDRKRDASQRNVVAETQRQEQGSRKSFKVEDVNWEELAGIGILKDELEMSGELDTLLKGEKTNVIRLSLVLLGVDVVMDATLQLVRKDGGPLLEILGIKPIGQQ